MPVTVKTETEEEKQTQEQDVKDKQDAAAEELIKDMDLPLPQEVDDEGGDVKTKVDPKIPKEEEEEEPEETEEEEEEEEPEEVVSKSKFKKRVDSLTAKNRILEARLAEQEETPPDSRKAKLENMSETELKSMKTEARRKCRVAIREENDTLAEQYDDLQDEIDDILRSAPEKFQKAQAKAYDTAVKEVQVDPDNEDIDFDKSGEDIKTIATDIYQKYPDLQKLKAGQATALKMAVDHFRETQKFTKGKSSLKELKQKNNKLKRKTALDSSAIKGTAGKGTSKVKYLAAKKSNSFYDKLDYANDFLDVDAYLPPEHK